MQNLIISNYEKIKDLIDKDDYIKKINQIKNESDDLFDENICSLLLIDELNRSDYNNNKINNLEPGMESTLIVKIENIGIIREFQKKNGYKGRVINIDVFDETGNCKLVLWDNDVDLIIKNKITINSFIKIINGYVKNGIDGIEINIGRWSLIELLSDDFLSKNNLKNDKFLIGKILEISPTKPFFKNNGEYGFFSSIKIQEKNKIKKLFIWNEKVKEIQKYKPGDIIKFKGVETKNNNGINEKHVSINSIIEKIN